MTVNATLLRQVYDAITAPEETHPGLAWSQKGWALRLDEEDSDITRRQYDLPADWCGTVMCIAGWACYLHGDRPRLREGVFSTSVVVDGEGHRHDIEDRGKALLGLPSHRVFYMDRADALEELRSLLAEAEAAQ